MQPSLKKHVVGLTCLLLIGCLSACSNDSNHSSSGSNAKLQRAESRAALETYLKNGLKNAVSQNGNIANYPETETSGAGGAPVPDAGEGDGAGVSLGYSTTNLIEAGVDEPDLVKFDGTYIFVGIPTSQYCMELCEPMISVQSETPLVPASTSNAVRIMRTSDAEHSATEITRVEIPLSEKYDNQTLDGLFLLGDDNTDALVTITNGTKYATGQYDDATWTSIWAWTQGGTIIDNFDVSSDMQTGHRHRIEIDGYLVQSRRIDNTLYVVTRYTPTVDQTGSQSDQIAKIDAASLEQLLPTVSIDGETSPLVSAQDCYVDSSTDGYPTLMVVSAINLADNSIDSACVTANLYSAYMSKNAVYLSQVEWSSEQTEQTTVYKFSLTDNVPEYKGEGTVPGALAASDNFVMSEHDNVLRLVTYDWNASAEIKNHLFTLQESEGGGLEILGSLPNAEHPAPIGKPGELIQGVRFVGDKAYVVTFLRIDPLYVIDLSNPQNPFIVGEIELPGFSSLLQPLNNNLLLGIGSDGGFLKVELYDVQNPAAPTSLASYTMNQSNENYSGSPAQWDHHALALQQLPDQTIRAAMGYYSSSYINDEYLESKGALTLVVDTQQRQMQSIAPRQVDDGNYLNGIQRTVLHDNTLHYIESSSVWSSAWSGSPLAGPQ